MKSGLWKHMQHKKLVTIKGEGRVIESFIFLKMLNPSYPLSHAHLEYSLAFNAPNWFPYATLSQLSYGTRLRYFRVLLTGGTPAFEQSSGLCRLRLSLLLNTKHPLVPIPVSLQFRVQFNDTLTSTFEYPSEASQAIDDPQYADPHGNVSKHHQLLYEEQIMLQHHQQQQQHKQQQQQQHHHVTVDEIIELPASTSTSTSASASHKPSATSAMLGNLPLGKWQPYAVTYINPPTPPNSPRVQECQNAVLLPVCQPACHSLYLFLSLTHNVYLHLSLCLSFSLSLCL